MPQRLKRRSEINHEDSPEPTRQRRDETAEASEVDEADDSTMNIRDATTSGPPPLDQMTKKLVRLALATEFTRQPLRRADITSKVLDPHNRMFKPVFRAAQQALREKFGMSLMELPLKERVTVAQKRAAQRAGHATSQAGKQSATNKSWVLVSTLPSALRAATVLGPTRNPNATAEAEYVGLYSFVVSIVYLSQGARISEGKMERYLARCDAGEYVLGGEKIDNVLKKMERQGYIIKVRDREPGGEETIDWILGPRGKVEVGEKGVAGLVKMVYGKKDTEMEDLEDKLERSLGAGTFKRKTSRGGEVDEEEDVEQEGARTRGRGHTNGDADDDNEEGGTQTGRSSRSQTLLAPQARRSTTRRRSNLIDDTAVARDDEEEEEEEEEEDDDDDEEAEDDEDEE